MDRNVSTGRDDDDGFPPGPRPVEGATIGILDIGTHVAEYTPWLDLLGYSYSVIPLDSDYDILVQYPIVLLPFSNAEPCCRNYFVQHAADYHQYVADGGCLYVGQPNPFMQKDPDIPWVPYSLQLDAFYDPDCPRHITNPDHCITKGLSPR